MPQLVHDIAARLDLSAGAYIVTLFGDVVEPRGGRLATGDLLAACARVGLNPTRARTAVSRLVAAGRLSGAREGRRSHYRLTPEARAEFAAAARAIFAPAARVGWSFLWAPQGSPIPNDARQIGAEFWLAPGGNGAGFSARSPADAAPLQALARKLWPLDDCAASYAEFEALFEPLAAVVPDTATALDLRLLLTHRFRAAALADPGLPRAALPPDWRGDTARRLFAQLYLALSPAAEAAIPALCGDGERPLLAQSAAGRTRAAALRRFLSAGASG